MTGKVTESPPNPPPLTVSPSTTDQELRALRLHVSPATPTSISIHFLHADCILRREIKPVAQTCYKSFQSIHFACMRNQMILQCTLDTSCFLLPPDA